MNQTAAQVDYLQRTLDITFGMLASLIEVTVSRLDFWVNGEDHENPKFDRVFNLYSVVDIAIKFGIPQSCLLNMLQEPINGEEEGVTLLFLVCIDDMAAESQFPGFDDEVAGYLDFLERFETSLNLEAK